MKSQMPDLLHGFFFIGHIKDDGKQDTARLIFNKAAENIDHLYFTRFQAVGQRDKRLAVF